METFHHVVSWNQNQWKVFGEKTSAMAQKFWPFLCSVGWLRGLLQYFITKHNIPAVHKREYCSFKWTSDFCFSKALTHLFSHVAFWLSDFSKNSTYMETPYTHMHTHTHIPKTNPYSNVWSDVTVMQINLQCLAREQILVLGLQPHRDHRLWWNG